MVALNRRRWAPAGPWFRTAPDGAKAMIVLLFTESRAVVRLEFDSAPGDPMPPQVVTDVGKQQQIAVRTGLTG